MRAINNSVITILVQSQISLILGGKGKASWRCGDKLRNVIIFDSAATEVKAIISQCPD